MQGCLRGREIGKREMPLNAVEQQKADLAHFREIRYSWKTTSKYLHKRNRLLVVFGARKSRENRIKSAPSCSIGINGFRRVTRYSRKWAPEVPKNIYDYVGFPHGFLEKWEMGSPECFVLLSFSWYSGAPCRHFGSKWGPGPKTFHFVQVFIGVLAWKYWDFVPKND